MPDTLLNLFKYLLIALIWLFFLRVLRAVWVESKGESRSMVVAAPSQVPVDSVPTKAKNASPTGRSSNLNHFELVVISGSSLEVGSRFTIDGPLTIGRGQGCNISMPRDTFASSVHARVYTNTEQVIVEDLDSTNGTFVNGKKVTGSQVIVSGDRLQIGQTIFEVSL